MYYLKMTLHCLHSKLCKILIFVNCINYHLLMASIPKTESCWIAYFHQSCYMNDLHRLLNHTPHWKLNKKIFEGHLAECSVCILQDFILMYKEYSQGTLHLIFLIKEFCKFLRKEKFIQHTQKSVWSCTVYW